MRTALTIFVGAISLGVILAPFVLAAHIYRRNRREGEHSTDGHAGALVVLGFVALAWVGATTIRFLDLLYR